MMKRRLLMGLLTLLFSLPSLAEVYEGACGEKVRYSLDTETWTLTLKGEGSFTSFNCPWQAYKDSIRHIEADDAIVFPNNWLSDYESITEPQYNGRTFIYMPSTYPVNNYTIPEGIKVVAPLAFYGCKNLRKVTVPVSCEYIGWEAFSRCHYLTEVILSEGLKTLGNSVFEGCSKLSVIRIPNSLENVGTRCFNRCDNLLTPLYNNHCFFYLPRGTTGTYAIPGSPVRIAPSAFNSASIQSVIIPSTVKEIGEEAFSSCENLESVNLPQGLTTIESSAFWNCYKLGNLTLPKTLTYLGSSAFHSCRSLTEMVIPQGIDTLRSYTFQNCPLLHTLQLPEGLKCIESDLLGYETTSALKKVNLPESITEVGRAFMYCDSLSAPLFNRTIFAKLPTDYKGTYTVPDGIKTIAYGAFYNSQSLEKVVLPSSVKEVGASAFAKCSSLQRADLPDCMTSVPWHVYEGCGYLQEAPIPSGATHIYDKAFYGCASLKQVTIPQSVNYIGHSAFAQCTQLADITLPEQVDTLGSGIFYECTSLKSPISLGNKFLKCPQTANRCEIPEGVEYIDDYALAYCEKLLYVKLPQSLKGVGRYAFANAAFEEIVLPESVDTIGEHAFENCWFLPRISIPEGVRYLQPAVFAKCKRLKEVQLPASLLEIGDAAFEQCASLSSLTLPDELAKIRPHAFQGCTALEHINIPNKIEEILWDTFKGCTSLKRLMIPAATRRVDEDAFEGCTSLSGIDVASENPYFASNSGMLCNKDLTEVVAIPSGLTDLVIPKSLRESKDGWNRHLPHLSQLRSATFYYVEDGYKFILGRLFSSNPERLPAEIEVDADGKEWRVEKEKYNLPATLKKLVFYCDSLSMDQFVYTDMGYLSKEIYFTGNLDKIDTLLVYCDTITDTKLFNQFKNLKVLEAKRVENLVKGSFTGMEYLERLKLSQVQTMEAGVLADLKGLKDLTLPFAGSGSASTATNFGTLFDGVADDSKKRVVQFKEDGSSETYYLPARLEKLTLSEGCENLGFGTFYNCNMLRVLTLPATLYMVGEKALYGCAGLTDIYCKGADPSSAYSNTFEGVRVNSCKLHVPHGSGEMYKRSTGWKDFYYIEEEAPITITVTKNIENAGVIYGMNEYQYGQTAELKAVAHSGYSFSAWTENGKVVSKEETYSFVVEGSRSLIAVFVPVSDNNSVVTEPGSNSVAFTWAAEEGASCYRLNVYRDEAMTQLAGSLLFDDKGNPMLRSTTMLTATIDGLDAATGYYYRMTAYDEAEQVISQYTGTFETKEATGIANTESADEDVTVRVASGRIIVEGAEGKQLSVFEASGKLAVCRQVAGQTEEIALERGFYLVKVGNSSYKVIVK